MKKMIVCTIVAIATCLFAANPIFADEAKETKWIENDPSFEIYRDFPEGEFYNVGSYDGELVPEGANIYLLMINGGFVTNPQIVIENGRTLVPIRIISEILGAKVDWNASDKTAVVTDGGNAVILAIDSKEAKINDKTVVLDVPPTIINERTYVPLRFVAEALNAEVEYVPNFQDYHNINIIVIEKPTAGAKVFTHEEGLETVKRASVESYEISIPYGFYEGTDAENISYTGETMGRYYVYTLNETIGYGSGRSCYFNKYTGNIYDNFPSLDTYLWIHEGLHWFPLAG